MGGVLSPALNCLQRLSGCVLLPSTIWIVSFFCIYVVAILLLVRCRSKKREIISKHVYVIIGCSVSLESLFCASAWHSGYPTVTPQIHWAGLRLEMLDACIHVQFVEARKFAFSMAEPCWASFLN